MEMTESLTKSDSPDAALASLGAGKKHESAEGKAGRSGHEEDGTHKPTTYARQC